jgi:hypothetical protein
VGFVKRTGIARLSNALGHRLSDRVSSRARSSVRSLGVLVAIGAVAAACGTAIDERTPAAESALTVKPRVVLDGLAELSARAGEPLYIDQVLLHAPVASSASSDLLASEGRREALLFRYDVAASDGYGDVVGGEHRWTLPATQDDLRVGFAPLSTQDATALAAATGVSLDELAGHTAIVHGYLSPSCDSEAGNEGNVATAIGMASGFVTGSAPRGVHTAASGSTTSTASTDGEIDPDGTPAKPTDTSGTDGEIDPDGTPAKPTDTAGTASTTDGEIDPDGTPAKPASKSTGEIDPDGTPAKPRVTWLDGRIGSAHLVFNLHAPTGTPHAQSIARCGGLVPFTIVIDAPFALDVSLHDVKAAHAGDVVPLDLHVQLADLLPASRIEALQHAAQAAVEQGSSSSSTVLELAGVEASAAFGLVGVHSAQGQWLATHAHDGLRVTGDDRR